MNKRRRILLIDDDRDDQVNFCRVIYEIDPGMECLLASNGSEALLHLRTIKPSPEIIFLDLNMPMMNGLEYLSEIRSKRIYDDIPIVVYTSNTSEETWEKCRRFGVSGILVKPNDINILRHELQSILEQYQFSRQSSN